jgi:hypothetical protein
MKNPFAATWVKVAARKTAREQFQYISDNDVRKEWKRRGFEDLNLGRKMALRLYWLKAEVQNGGLDQYFWNFSGNFANDTVEDLRRIGLPAAAAILTQGAQKLFGRSEVPTDINQRRREITAKYGTHPFNDDDDAERLKVLEEKEMLVSETDQLSDGWDELVVAMMAWMFNNRSHFTHIKD